MLYRPCPAYVRPNLDECQVQEGVYLFWVGSLHPEPTLLPSLLTIVKYKIRIEVFGKKKKSTKTPAAISHGFRRYSQYASTIPRATWHMSTAAAPSLRTPYTLQWQKKKNENERKRADLSYDTRRRIASYFKKRNERNNNKERKG